MASFAALTVQTSLNAAGAGNLSYMLYELATVHPSSFVLGSCRTDAPSSSAVATYQQYRTLLSECQGPVTGGARNGSMCQLDPAANRLGYVEPAATSGRPHARQRSVRRPAPPERRGPSAAIGLVTNATTRLDDALALLDLSDALDFVVNSSSVGCAKPSRCFYEHAARRCGCERGAVLFVDDRPENVEAAIDFGFHGHLYRNPPTIERRLCDWNLTDKDV